MPYPVDLRVQAIPGHRYLANGPPIPNACAHSCTLISHRKIKNK